MERLGAGIALRDVWIVGAGCVVASLGGAGEVIVVILIHGADSVDAAETIVGVRDAESDAADTATDGSWAEIIDAWGDS